MANSIIRLGNKSAAWFTANATRILADGQLAYLNDNSGQFKKGDGITALSALPFLGSQTLAQTTALGATTIDIITVGGVTLPTETASQIAYLDANKDLKTLPVATYPSLLELSYAKGALSNLQNQINNINAGNNWKVSARGATTANVVLSGLQTIDGVLQVAGERWLVPYQTAGSENGIYVVSAGAWTRALDADTGTELLQATISIQEGTVNADLIFTCTTNAPITLGTTALVFAKTSSSSYTASDGVVLTGNNFTLNNAYFSGDATVLAGVVTIGAAKVTNAMLAPMTSAQLAGVITDETGTGALVFGTNPTFTTQITTPKIVGVSGATGLIKETNNTAAAALAIGNSFLPTLVAAANNDTLIALDVNPTFTNGTFTGLLNYGLRVRSGNVVFGNAVPLFNYEFSIVRNQALQTSSGMFNNNAAGSFAYGMVESGAERFYFYRVNSVIAGSIDGTSIPIAGSNQLYGFSAAGYLIIKQNTNTPIVNIIGVTGTNIGTRLDTVGYRIGALSTLHTANTVAFEVSGKSIFGNTIRLKGYTVATLPAGVQGDKAFVTDALAPTYLVTVAGGGTVVTEVFYNGAAWVCT